MSIITRLLKRLVFPESYSQEVFISVLKNKYHVDIGDNCRIYSPNSIYIDKQRGHMLHIGNNCKLTRNVTILTHDFSRGVCASIPGFGNVGEAAYTYIGDNVFIGVNSTILMGSRIGNNSIVGAGAVVSGYYPDNVVIAGNPSKIICTIDEFYNKRKEMEIIAAKEYVHYWKRTYDRNPNIHEMTNAFSWLYIPHTKESIREYSDFFKLGGVDEEILIDNFLNSDSIYNSFEDFLHDCK